jgi:predicted outer membrane repeat protein
MRARALFRRALVHGATPLRCGSTRHETRAGVASRRGGQDRSAKPARLDSVAVELAERRYPGMASLRGTDMKSVLRGFVLVVGLVVASLSHATYIYKVGADAACTHSTIQAAIDAAATSAGEDYVWIASNQTYSGQHVVINNQVVDVVGGFADCSASDAGVAITTVSGTGNGGAAVFAVRGTSSVFMSNLWIRNADRSGDGGGIDFAGAGGLRLERTTVSLNSAEHGGGINFRGTGGDAELHIGHDTLVLSNTANVSGGGIRVEGSARLFVLEAQTLVAFNSATGDGGGIEVLAPARADIASAGYNGGAVLQFNDADYGGGIAVNTNNDNNVFVRLFSTDANNPVQISNNTARSTGGGIWLSPYSSVTGGYREATLCAQDFRINNNIAQEGAAIYGDVDTDGLGESMPSRVVFNRTSLFNLVCSDPEPVEDLGAVPCAAGVACNELAYNVAEDSAGNPSGAIILMQTDGEFSALRFRMHHNIARYLIRSVADDVGNDTDLSRCLLTDNQLMASAILQTPGDDDGHLVIDECTFARNSIANGAVLEVNKTDTTITRSIFDQPGVPILSSSGWDHVSADLVMSNDLSTLPPWPDDMQAAPLFVDPDHGDYHLRRDSPGIDYVTDSSHFIDLDGNARKVDLPNHNIHGIQDVGALETQLSCSVSDSIFCSGFDPD